MASKKRTPSRVAAVVGPPDSLRKADGSFTPALPPMAPWKAVVFGDLHVKASTLDRCLTVLRNVRELALAHKASVVCTGDFWDQRGTLSVRQLDAIQSELDNHCKAGIQWVMIPGNHDQVTRDGSIHAMRVFENYPNVVVAGDLLLDDHRQIAYVPWREDPAVATAMFASIPAGYTAFGHGEIKGATTNAGHKAEGRFAPGTVRHLRAVYLGHYHERQAIGHVHYIGSPYEQNFGERSTPHGVAVVSNASVDPVFVVFDGMPKHWRMTWPDDKKLLPLIRKDDIVEILAPKAELRSPAFMKALAGIAADDVRPLPISSPVAGDHAPAFALSIQEAVDKYVDDAKPANAASLKALGHGLLRAVADVKAIPPLGSVIHFTELEVTGFCAVRDLATLQIGSLGTCLLRGPMGAGKTALASDALTWCLYGTTAPRKAGIAGSSLKADEVIHDEVESVCVGVSLTLDTAADVYRIVRTKKRGKGATLVVSKNGDPFGKAGISDAQDLVQHVIGLDYDLWRTCVSLGQGEAQNFVTDAQKRRTELLERAFQLEACPPAQDIARKRSKEIQAKVDPLQVQVAGIHAKLEQLAAVDCGAESGLWETNRRFRVGECLSRQLAASERERELSSHLAHEGAWTTRAAGLREQMDALVDRVRVSDLKPKVGKLHSQIGAATAELGNASAAHAKLIKSYADSQKARVCSTCGQALPADMHEDHLAEMERQIENRRSEVSSFETRVANLKSELGQIAVEGTPESAALATSMSELRTHITEADSALSAIAAIRIRLAQATREVRAEQVAIENANAERNPWEAKQREQDAQADKLRNSELTATAALTTLLSEKLALDFWVDGFGATGLPVLVLRTALYELEMYANSFLSRIMQGRVSTELAMDGSLLQIKFFEHTDGGIKERDFLQLSGGQRRCVQLAFAPFALSEMIFNRTGVRIPFLVIDELTTHLDADTKPIVCEVLRELDRETIIVIDHDPLVQGEFDVVYDVAKGGRVTRAA